MTRRKKQEISLLYKGQIFGKIPQNISKQSYKIMITNE
jgi:hypothetical protein